MSGEKIQLRLKTDPTRVMPEAGVYAETDTSFVLDFGAEATVRFPKRDWEPVPPPYELPTGIGTVVRAAHGTYYIRVNVRTWVGTQSASRYNEDLVLGWGRNGELTTLSEGIEL